MIYHVLQSDSLEHKNCFNISLTNIMGIYYLMAIFISMLQKTALILTGFIFD